MITISVHAYSLTFVILTTNPMSNNNRKFSTTSLLASLALGVVVGGSIYSLLKPPPAPVECKETRFLAVFDKDDVRRMLDERDAEGVRFYLAKGANMTVVAGPIRADQSHCPETTGSVYQEYVKLDGSTAEVDAVKEDVAERTIRNSNTPNKPTWSIDASRDALNDLRNVPYANAIGVVERRTTSGEWAFDLAPVEIKNSVAKPVGDLSDQLSAAPCPRFCGADAALYLHRR